MAYSDYKAFTATFTGTGFIANQVAGIGIGGRGQRWLITTEEANISLYQRLVVDSVVGTWSLVEAFGASGGSVTVTCAEQTEYGLACSDANPVFDYTCSPMGLEDTDDDMTLLESRVTNLEINGVGGGTPALVKRIIDPTGNASNTALHLAYAPLALTVLASSAVGFYGSLESHTPGTVKLVLPSGFEVLYQNLGAGLNGRPVVAFRGGRIDFIVSAPNRIIIRGDYVTTADDWHPTDAGDDLLGLWKAGPNIINGGHVSFPCADTESVTFTAELMMRWEAMFGSRENARWVYDWLGNTEGGGDQGTAPGDYAPSLVADATFAGGYAYILRTGAATSRICRAKDVDGDMTLTTPCRIFIALRQISGLTQGDTTLLRVNSSPAYTSLLPGGLQWRGSGNNGYQYVHVNSGGSWGAKGGTFNTHENTLNAVLLTLVLDSSGGGQIYSGSTLVSGAMTVHASTTQSFLQFYTGLNAHLGGIAIVAGTSSDLPAEIAAMEALLIA